MVGAGVESVRTAVRWYELQPYGAPPTCRPRRARFRDVGGSRPTSRLDAVVAAPRARAGGAARRAGDARTGRRQTPGRHHVAARRSRRRSAASWPRSSAATARAGSLWAERPDLPRVPIRAWQIWNEPNLTRYWSEQPFARSYVRLLRAADAALRGGRPAARRSCSPACRTRAGRRCARSTRPAAAGTSTRSRCTRTRAGRATSCGSCGYARREMRERGDGAAAGLGDRALVARGEGQGRTRPAGFEVSDRGQAREARHRAAAARRGAQAAADRAGRSGTRGSPTETGSERVRLVRPAPRARPAGASPRPRCRCSGARRAGSRAAPRRAATRAAAADAPARRPARRRRHRRMRRRRRAACRRPRHAGLVGLGRAERARRARRVAAHVQAARPEAGGHAAAHRHGAGRAARLRAAGRGPGRRAAGAHRGLLADAHQRARCVPTSSPASSSWVEDGVDAARGGVPAEAGGAGEPGGAQPLALRRVAEQRDQRVADRLAVGRDEPRRAAARLRQRRGVGGDDRRARRPSPRAPAARSPRSATAARTPPRPAYRPGSSASGTWPSSRSASSPSSAANCGRWPPATTTSTPSRGERARGRARAPPRFLRAVCDATQST